MKNNQIIDCNKKSNIKSFSIFGLFGMRDIIIPFDNNIKILIGENGLGKTSVLNALYYTLIGEFSKLNSIVFDKLVLDFHSGNVIEISSDDLMFIPESEVAHKRILQIFNRLYTETEKEIVIKYIQNANFDNNSSLLNRIYARVPYPRNKINKVLLSIFIGEHNKVEEFKAILKKELKEDVLYFPTYRRIEEELHNLGSDRGQENNFEYDKRLIQFGMNDVEDTIDSVLQSIKNSALEGFSSITGKMLSQYVDGLHETDTKIESEKLNIILERVGENITPDYKESIIDLVKSGKIIREKDRYKYLVNFLSNLIKIYEQQEPVDNSIKRFAMTCNGYLIAKRMIYNESKVTLKIIQSNNEEEIELKNLSSGEKQIISLFSKIILEPSQNNNDLIVLFDEPELSLSIEWQQKLLPDILKSGKCNFLMGVTHSPFIFDNELDFNAEDMNKYITEKYDN